MASPVPSPSSSSAAEEEAAKKQVHDEERKLKVDKKLSEASTLVGQLKIDQGQLRNNVSDLKQEFSNLIDNVRVKINNGVSEMKKEIAELEEKVKEEKQEKENLERDLSSKNEETNVLKNQIGELTGKGNELTESLTRMESEKNRLSDELREANQLNERLQSRDLESQNAARPAPRHNLPSRRKTTCFLLMAFAYYSLGVFFSRRLSKDIKGLHDENNTVTNALYFMVVTSFTIGFGDITPQSGGAKAMTCILVILGLYEVDSWTTIQGQIWTNVKMRYLSHPDHVWRSAIIMHVVALFAIGFSTSIGLAIIHTCENGPDAMTHKLYGMQPGDALYLAAMTLTTEGYGDLFIKTSSGRFWAVLWIVLFQNIYASSVKFIFNSFVGKIRDFFCGLIPFCDD